jgi:molybdate transport system substrate-binding protein
MPDIHILSGGAANGLVMALAPTFEAETGYKIKGDYGAVGGMRKRILEGERPDLVILTSSILKELGQVNIVESAGVKDIGSVATSVAVRSNDARPDVSTPTTLRAALLAADGIYFPDPVQATAGIHFQKVLNDLGILQTVSPRLRTFPNGATAMRAIAECNDQNPIGSTQATEIVATEGVQLIADLPAPHGLLTVYSIGLVQKNGTDNTAAKRLISLLISQDNAALRKRCAFS